MAPFAGQQRADLADGRGIVEHDQLRAVAVGELAAVEHLAAADVADESSVG